MNQPAQTNSIKLVCVSGPDQGKRLVIREQPTTIGKSVNCDLASDDVDVAERHVTLRAANDRLILEVSEGQAVFVDGQRVQQTGHLNPVEQMRIGRSIWKIESSAEVPSEFSAFLGNLSGRITAVAGTEKIEGFKAQEMFSEVLRRRTDEEMEAYFAVGTPTTTPALADVTTSWPKPWLFVKIFVLLALVYCGLLFAFKTYNNSLMIPGLLTVGGFMMPFALLIFFFEMNVLRNVPLYQILKMLFLGGILSVIAALFLLTQAKLSDSWLGAITIGIIEEAGKVVALLLVVNKLKYRWILNGMLFGAAVGAGFAGFESAGYGGKYGPENITLRAGLCILGGHVMWCALSGAALWRVRGDRKFEWSMLGDLRFLRIFALVAVLHGVWDSPLSSTMYLKYIVLGFVAWVAILSYIQVGLKQVRDAQAQGATEFFKKQPTS